MLDFLERLSDDLGWRAKIHFMTAFLIGFVCLFIIFVFSVILSVKNFFAGSYSLKTNLPFFHKEDRVLAWFCEDIFQKEYSKITKEEKDSIRYIFYSPSAESGSAYPIIYYSFTDYSKCINEEEFSETVFEWNCAKECEEIATDYTMFSNLTRVGISESMVNGGCRFQKDSPIQCIEWYGQQILPEGIQAEAITEMHYRTHGVEFEKLKDYPALEVFSMDSLRLDNSELDVGVLGEYTQLKKIILEGNSSYAGLEKLKKIKGLETLSILGEPVENCSFLKDLPHIKELGIYTEYSTLKAFLPKLKKIEKLKLLLEISDSDLKEIKHRYPNLKGLWISVGRQKTIDGISDFKKLEDLKVELIHIEDDKANFASFSKLKKLKRLVIKDTLGGKDILGTNAFFNLPKLVSLTIDGEYSTYTDRTKLITNDKKLISNSSLQQLNISGCKSEDANDSGKNFNFVHRFTGLKILSLTRNNMTHIDFVTSLPELKILNLDYSPVRSYKKAEGCPQLQVICSGSDLHLVDEFPEHIYIDKRK